MQSEVPIFTSLREAGRSDRRIEEDGLCIKQPRAIYLARHTPCEPLLHMSYRAAFLNSSPLERGLSP